MVTASRLGVSIRLRECGKREGDDDTENECEGKPFGRGDQHDEYELIGVASEKSSRKRRRFLPNDGPKSMRLTSRRLENDY
jgi:hypothetical protein